MLKAKFKAGIDLPASADFHVHLRDDEMMKTVVPTIRSGGVNVVYVMPNLQPPITTPSQAQTYKSHLQALDPSVHFLMTLYLNSSTTPELIRAAREAGIAGLKAYPAGVTTNSAAGVTDYEPFYPVFRAMEEEGLVLNLHGECQSSETINELNAEQAFLPTLLKLHADFPRLRIVLEHCTSADAIEAVLKCGPNVVGTITAHHLYLTRGDWEGGDGFAYCKPVAKEEADRKRLVQAVINGGGKFFLGSDSAPHSVKAKTKGHAAGIFTGAYATQLVLGALEEAVESGVVDVEDVTIEGLEGFLGGYGRKFYGVDQLGREERIKIHVEPETIKNAFGDEESGDNGRLVPFRAGQETWSLTWTSK